MSANSVTLRATAIALTLVFGVGLSSARDTTTQKQDASLATDEERVAKNKATILGRMKRDQVGFRGDKPGEIRIKWEWYDKVVTNYIYEKQALFRELSAGEKYDLRVLWVYKNMKVTFQELFQLGPEDDDKLLPLLSHQLVLDMAPISSFEGLILLGKHGENKGPIVRKYKQKFLALFGLSIGLFNERLEYKESGGKTVTAAITWGMDAFTVRWKDIKNRIADDMSEAKAIEDLKLERDATFPEGDEPRR